ncbi:hypothetical protein HEQ45_02705 [Lactobacillus sp. ZJLC29-4]|nr:hypothetical protein [Lactobacillus sp. HBUAS51387]
MIYMILLAVIGLSLITYKFFTNWLWELLLIIIVLDLGLWIYHHLGLILLVTIPAYLLYTKLTHRHQHHYIPQHLQP